jgi:hypothetical protein
MQRGAPMARPCQSGHYALVRRREFSVLSAALVALSAVLCGCSSSKSTSSTVATTTTPEHSGRDALTLRLVKGILPVGDASLVGRSCKPKPPATATSENGAEVVVLTDGAHKLCYVVGPVLLTGRDITSAEAVQNTSTGTWDVNVHYPGNEFVAKIARPYVNQTVAIVYNDVVESAPTVNPGITTNDVTISGNLNKEQAQALASALS